MTTKFGMIMTLRLSPIKLHDPFVMWSLETIWKTKTIISPLPQFPPTKLHNILIEGSCKITWQTKTIIS